MFVSARVVQRPVPIKPLYQRQRRKQPQKHKNLKIIRKDLPYKEGEKIFKNNSKKTRQQKRPLIV